METYSCGEVMQFNIGDIFVYTSALDNSRSVITIVDYVYREYIKKYVYVLEHNFVSYPQGRSHISHYDKEEDNIITDNAIKHYTYYPVVK